MDTVLWCSYFGSKIFKKNQVGQGQKYIFSWSVTHAFQRKGGGGIYGGASSGTKFGHTLMYAVQSNTFYLKPVRLLFSFVTPQFNLKMARCQAVALLGGERARRAGHLSPSMTKQSGIVVEVVPSKRLYSTMLTSMIVSMHAITIP